MLRETVERRSAVVLVALSAQPRALVALAVGALFAGLLLLPPVPAALCLLVLLGVLGWLIFLSWPALDRRARVLRLVVFAGLLVLGLTAIG